MTVKELLKRLVICAEAEYILYFPSNKLNNSKCIKVPFYVAYNQKRVEEALFNFSKYFDLEVRKFQISFNTKTQKATVSINTKDDGDDWVGVDVTDFLEKKNDDR